MIIGFIVQALNGGKNYTNDLDTDLRSALLEIGFYYIPQKVQTLIPSDTNAFNITRDDFANSVVDKISDKNLIFPLIRDCRLCCCGTLYQFVVYNIYQP